MSKSCWCKPIFIYFHSKFGAFIWSLMCVCVMCVRWRKVHMHWCKKMSWIANCVDDEEMEWKIVHMVEKATRGNIMHAVCASLLSCAWEWTRCLSIFTRSRSCTNGVYFCLAFSTRARSTPQPSSSSSSFISFCVVLCALLCCVFADLP